MNSPLYQSKFLPGLLRGAEDSRRSAECLRSPDVAEILSFEALNILGLPLQASVRPSRSQLASPSQQSPVALLKKAGHSEGHGGSRKARNSPPVAIDPQQASETTSPKELNFPPRDFRDSRSDSHPPSPPSFLPTHSPSTSPDQIQSPQMAPTSDSG